MRLVSFSLLLLVELIYSSPAIKNAEYQVKQVYATGLKLDIADIDVSFSETVYFPEAFSCPLMNCTARALEYPAECICNYASTNPSVCGVVPVHCTPCDQSFCMDSWTELRLNEPITMEIDQNYFESFR